MIMSLAAGRRADLRAWAWPGRRTAEPGPRLGARLRLVCRQARRRGPERPGTRACPQTPCPLCFPRPRASRPAPTLAAPVKGERGGGWGSLRSPTPTGHALVADEVPACLHDVGLGIDQAPLRERHPA